MPADKTIPLRSGKLIILLAGCLFSFGALTDFDLNQAMLDRIDKQYGETVKQRFVAWQQLIATGKTGSDQDKLQRVNDFFNQNIRFVDDRVSWGKSDYWASPGELLVKGAGDCEDYSIAKYFTLLEMGVAESKLRITYVKALELNQAHMVLTYFESPRAEPLVLDNLKAEIKPSSQRSDLMPVYSFNGNGLWLAKRRGSGQQVGGSERLSLWTDLKQRMLENRF